MKEFKNRRAEIENLEKLYKSKSPKLIVLYGRRRVGKTSLILELIKRHNGIYLLGRQETRLENLNRFSSELAEFFNDEVLKASPFQNWDAFFLYIAKKLKEKRFIVAIDEFPYLVGADKSIPSIMQGYWDSHLSRFEAFVIICGSSIAMMEESIGYKSPLYGRRTEQMLLEPLSFEQACEFLPQTMGVKEKIEYYAMLGGTPAYLLEFDYAKGMESNLMDNLLQKSKFLYQDVAFVLREELSEPRNYFAILRAVSKGKNTLNEIVNETGLDRGVVSKYISILMDIHLAERMLPITEKKSSRKGIYRLRDNFFRFWFRFVHGNEEYIEQNKQELLLKEKILPGLNSYTGEVFENIALGFISQKPEYRNFVFGKWWDKGEEIDIVGKSPEKIALIEVKWKELTEKEAEEILNILKEKSKKFPSGKKILSFGIIAKKIQNKHGFRNKKLIAYDLKDF
ncbi:ATP-binding protein [Candidatus Pacearchaeota archaeon]|nr:ATP-binding protein [Candidatus Pacearchaeota archaeon]